ncbi:MAG TPA: glucan biosynthesis protein, partial [Myxococcaceae bacterium]|nr:glucan biosynthesis protein [Myxococcaceae bacterium]
MNKSPPPPTDPNAFDALDTVTSPPMPFRSSLLVAVVVVAGTLSALPVLAAPAANDTAATTPFSADMLRERARAMAQAPYVEPAKPDAALEGITYDQLRAIRFRPDQALWKKENFPFQLQFFHMGYYFKTPVELFTIRGGQAKPVAFDPALFDYGPNKLDPAALNGLGFAGFRVHFPINKAEYLDEAAVFLGASYFRSLGKNQGYGLSARGLAIDTAEPKGEEFPWFRTFYIEQPVRGAKELVVHALLDSQSATGAYRFVLKPGETTRMEVTASVFPRKAIGKLGVAPLTSMYLFGENDRGSPEDFRPEVHDSDGLAIWNGTGERLWRPLSNPSRLRVSTFQVNNPKGFGLFQRDQSFPNYEDLESRYERRPTLWVEPQTGFEAGSVSLVEIPSNEEIHDNMVAFFTPAVPVKGSEELRFAYRLNWGPPVIPGAPPTGETLATREGAGTALNRRKFVIDFAAPNPGPAANTALKKGAGGRAAKSAAAAPEPTLAPVITVS